MTTRQRLARQALLLGMFGTLFLLVARIQAAEESGATDQASIQTLIDEMRDRLGIPQPVGVALVTENPRMASVEAVKGRRNAFVLSIERAFLSRLSEDDLRSVVAHELGHVWIFTHHPYLQTEQLANRVAMRIVSRDSLERVYEKVWQDGAKGDRARFLGLAPADRQPMATTAAASPR